MGESRVVAAQDLTCLAGLQIAQVDNAAAVGRRGGEDTACWRSGYQDCVPITLLGDLAFLAGIQVQEMNGVAAAGKEGAVVGQEAERQELAARVQCAEIDVAD